MITRPLSDEQLQLAESLGLDTHVQPAIVTESRKEWAGLEALLQHPDYPILAFTSRNAVIALKSCAGNSRELLKKKRVYAVGEKTASELQLLGCEPLLPDQSDGTGLAKKIANDLLTGSFTGKPGVLHLCGNRRRNEFRQFLEGSEIDVRDVVVYQTRLLKMQFNSVQKDAVLFYSPSAIESFRKSGGFEHPAHQSAELFAIGHTTGEELSAETARTVHISPEANSEQFLHFTAQILSLQRFN